MKAILSVVWVFLSLVAQPAWAGFDEGFAAYNNKDYAAALSEFQVLAEQGDARAQNALGVLYEHGQGVQQNEREAVKWYRLAADQRLAIAQFNLALRYDDGKGVAQDYQEAMRLYRLASDQGYMLPKFRIGYLHESGHGVRKDIGEAIKWYRQAAEGGLDQAQRRLGDLNAHGLGVRKDYGEAARWYRLAATQGDAEAQYRLGFLYEIGKGVPRDDDEAKKWYQLAADQGYEAAQKTLAESAQEAEEPTSIQAPPPGTNRDAYIQRVAAIEKSYEAAVAAYKRRDYATALREFHALALQGDARGQNGLGAMYEDGFGVPRDQREAVKWYKLSAGQGWAKAQFNLAEMYQTGKGVVQNSQEALRLYNLSAAQGYEPAQEALRSYRISTVIAEPNSDSWPISRIVGALRAAAERGNPEGQVSYGRLFESGEGVPKDYQQALYWKTKAAQQGYAQAQSSLGTTYYYGYASQGIPINRSQALKWYRQGAEGGDDHAQYMYGVMLAEGDNVQKDMRKAVYWWRKAADQDHRDATARLQKAESEGVRSQPTSLSKDNVIRTLQQRAQQGDPAAQRELGDRLFTGKGTPQDRATGIEWLRTALPHYVRKAEQGDADYQYQVGNMLWRINRGPAPVCFDWYKKAAAQGHVTAISALKEAPENTN